MNHQQNSPQRILPACSKPGLAPWICALSSALLCAVVSPIVLAHSSWPTFYSAKSALSIGADGLEVAMVIEIPTFAVVPRFRKHFKDLDLMEEIEAGRFEKLEDQFRDHMFQELGEGLSVAIDGQTVPGDWRSVETPINGKANEGFFVYMLEFVPKSPPVLADSLEVVIHNRLYPGENIIFAGYAEAKADWRVVESSAPQPPPGVDLTPGSAAELDMWTTDPALRAFKVSLSRTQPKP
jgi:hypothetical protein